MPRYRWNIIIIHDRYGYIHNIENYEDKILKRVSVMFHKSDYVRETTLSKYKQHSNPLVKHMNTSDEVDSVFLIIPPMAAKAIEE